MPAYISFDDKLYIAGHGRFFEVFLDEVRAHESDESVVQALQSASYIRHLMLGNLDEALRCSVVLRLLKVIHSIVDCTDSTNKCVEQLEPSIQNDFRKWLIEVEHFLQLVGTRVPHNEMENEKRASDDSHD